MTATALTSGPGERLQSTTGLPALDTVICGVRPGDSIVWKVASFEDYEAVARPFWQSALGRREPVVYFRFADHPELIPSAAAATRVRPNPEEGFERFITEIHGAIAAAKPGTKFLFDMFSDLARDWFSERMLGNFFVLTCPYLYATGAVSYYGMLRNFHSCHAAQPIHDAAQVLFDVHRFEDGLYLHPVKVDGRYTPTMHLLHRWDERAFVPISDSATTAAIAKSAVWPGLQSASYRMIGMWDRRFIKAEGILEASRTGEAPPDASAEAFDKLAVQLLTREPRVLELVRRYLTLEDLIDTWKHVVGSGMLGGKSVGLLLARAILRQGAPKWSRLLEQHDSFFIASDVFYTYLVQNGCWWIRQNQKSTRTLLHGLDEARARMLTGTFPAYLMSRFSDMLDYFGQSPIIVRSSSLLEDAFGNAFAGKYESVFCPNQGTRQQRLDQFLSAVRTVYASALSERALAYRARRGVLDRDEQMALLIQRVSGMQYGGVFYPQLAGVGLSYNPFVWHPDIEPTAGVLRLVVGLGTRAVERADDDYARIVALNAPFRRPEGSPEELRAHSQRRVDYLDLTSNTFASASFEELAQRSTELPAQFLAQRDSVEGRDGLTRPGPWRIELDRFLERAPVAEEIRELLAELRTAYGSQVEIEFTVNVHGDGSHRINLLQCRPLHVGECDSDVHVPATIAAENLLLRARGAVLGHGRVISLARLIYVVPSAYGRLCTRDRYSVARVVGKLNHLPGQSRSQRVMLMGPGRWGTRLPELGVPVAIGEINTVSVLCEIDAMHEGLTPDLSLGTHFFHEVTELDVLYLGYAMAREDNVLNEQLLLEAPNGLSELLPAASALADVVRVIHPPAGAQLVLTADHVAREAVLFFNR